MDLVLQIFKKPRSFYLKKNNTILSFESQATSNSNLWISSHIHMLMSMSMPMIMMMMMIMMIIKMMIMMIMMIMIMMTTICSHLEERFAYWRDYFTHLYSQVSCTYLEEHPLSKGFLRLISSMVWGFDTHFGALHSIEMSNSTTWNSCITLEIMEHLDKPVRDKELDSLT